MSLHLWVGHGVGQHPPHGTLGLVSIYRADVESGNQMLATRPRLELYLATVALSLIISWALAINKGHLGHA